MKTNDNYLSHVMEMHAQLLRQPFIDVLAFQAGPGLHADAIADLERTYDFVLPEELKIWYRQINGLQLKWRANKHFESTQHNGFLLYAEDVKGSILIQPLHELLGRSTSQHFLFSDSDASFQNSFWFAGEEFTYNSFGRNLYPLDMFSEDCCMAINANHQSEQAEIILLGDYYASWNATRCSTFEEYINCILQVYGYEDARYALYNDPENSVRKKPDFDIYLKNFFLTLK